jgi:MoxR-like ATPase
MNDLRERVLGQLQKVVIGQDDVAELMLSAVVLGGHVLLQGVPGVAKSLLANAFARTLDADYRRVQFTPDMLPSDLTGTMTLRAGELAFRPGPVFANVLLADEINRTPPKTQSALLEAMQERQVSLDGIPHPLPDPFLVVATQNPIEYEGTYPLPEAQLDRFLLRLRVGYPERDDEWGILERRLARGADEVELQTVVDRPALLELQAAIEDVHVSESVGRYIVDIVAATRTSKRLQVGASPRGAMALLKLSRGRAAVQSRDFVTPDDVKAVAVPALAHRLTLMPELWVQRISADQIVRETLEQVPTPSAEEALRSPE